MHIIIDPEFGRNHPLWSQNDNGTDIHIYPFSEDLIERILKWTKYWDDNYLYSRKIGDAFVQGWVPEADVNGWVNEGIRITGKMKEELPSLTVEKKFMSYRAETQIDY